MNNKSIKRKAKYDYEYFAYNLTEDIKVIMEDKGLTTVDIARRSYVKHAKVLKFFRGETVSLKVLFRISQVLNLKVSMIVKDLG